MNACDAVRDGLGGYVLGGLPDEDVVALEAHLDVCPACRGELDELAGLPELLDLALEAPPPAPVRLRDRVLSAAVSRRIRRRWTVSAAAVAILAALLGGLAGAQLASAPPEIEVTLESVEPFEVEGRAVLREDEPGVAIRLEMTGLERLEPGEVYEAWLSRHEDGLVSLGFLHPDGEGTLTATLEMPGTLADYRSFWVTAEPDTTSSHDGPTVVRVRLPTIVH